MAEKLTPAQEAQAKIVAEQEKAQSEPPYPTQADIDRARLGLRDEQDHAEGGVDKSSEAEKPASGYKTRAAKPE